MKPRIEALKQEQGAAMVLVMFLVAMLSLMSVLLIDTVQEEADSSAQAVERNAALQAAEAGIDDYVAKLVDDRLYYVHQVHPGEGTREEPGGTEVSAGTAWSYGLAWTYPNEFDTWRALSNGYEYSLKIVPPNPGEEAVHITAAGRKVGTTDDTRVVEALIRPSSIADFQRIVNGDVSWGSGATTNGKLYANGTIDHDGIAKANIYAEDNVTGSTTLQNGAKKYDHNTIRSVIKNPVNFNSLLASLVDVQRAAQVGGVYLDNPAVHGWRITFNANGTFSVQTCTRSGGNDIAAVQPNCVNYSPATYNVPSNGAVYAGQSVIVSGQVNGRVTVASNDNIVIANDISYVTSGSDVLGLVAKNNVYGAQWCPNNLTWRAAVLAQSGTWKGWTSSTIKNTMVHKGSSTTNLGGDWTMFATRDYSYDETLLFLPPPWFPTIEDAYTVNLFRELPGT
ncbi:MAG: pilus assembly PilX N-terminal domain-containing protein [Gaiellales bacterium]